ncbi:uncharacterized protein SPPG_07066 [Spizellomyces punctatus DAOM BR117]|uniref:Uncharacterized protein n=1 Tax=Spizellomyces punctatus (strain DAOM BR117) TaxID=645134 RepID=A0A0L0H8T9_SPIPD|nr:uncharacterized protein SPPG_07066 [Spizellomyces punctatus DAOM BR117]KNC97597.1 hypothetical protein SPPG_07066 [Spizellomyces punctatus DAOM BR117]|eukprot:XP_016605637.1 hypothetical protein SPPG_07066 [Spizellomyces punctatus DAOM BR117]
MRQRGGKITLGRLKEIVLRSGTSKKEEEWVRTEPVEEILEPTQVQSNHPEKIIDASKVSTYSYNLTQTDPQHIMTPDDVDAWVDTLFSQCCIMDILSLWFTVWVMDKWGSLPARVEWIGYSICSIRSLQKAWYLSTQVFMGLIVFLVCVDGSLFGVIEYEKVLTIVASIVVYGSVIGQARGYGLLTMCVVSVLVAVDYYTKHAPTRMDLVLGVHCVGHGLYVMLGDLVAYAVDKRMRYFAEQNVVYGELRAYPKHHHRKHKTWKLEKSFFTTTTTTTSNSRKRSNEHHQFYYSNHYEMHSRFELAVCEVGFEFITLTWSLPQSLIVTLCSLSDTKPKTTLSPPPTILGPMDEPLLLPPALPQSGSTTLSASDVDVMVNLSYWDQLTICMPEGVVVVRGLQVNREYTVVMAIRGYWSVPVRVCTADWRVAPPPLTPVTSTTKDGDTSQKHKTEVLRLLTRELTNLRTTKKNLHTALKKCRKESAKNLAALRSDLDMLKKAHTRDLQTDTRLRRRIQTLEEGIAQAKEVQQAKEAEINNVMREINENKITTKALVKQLESLHRTRTQSESELTRLTQLFQKRLQDLETTLAHLTTRFQSLQTGLSTTTQSLHSSSNHLTHLTKTLTSAQHRQTEQATLEKRRWNEEASVLRGACEGAKRRNEALQNTLAEQVRFREILECEIEAWCPPWNVNTDVHEGFEEPELDVLSSLGLRMD